MSTHALIISGGGAKGAWGVGVTHALVDHLQRNYTAVIGTSTGSLMGPLILGSRFSELRHAYTTVTQDKIFNVNPFKKDGGIKTFKVLWRIVRGKQSIGETENLRSLIREFIPEELYNEIKDGEKTFGATVTGLKSALSQVKILEEHEYEDMVDWIWASANQPVFMTLMHKDGDAWVDGGLKDFVSIKYVLDNNLSEEIDVIIHNTPRLINDRFDTGSGVTGILLRTIGIFASDVAQNDIAHARIDTSIDHSVNINFYFMEQSQVDLIGNSLIFDPEKMKQILDEGYQSVVDQTCTVESCHITPEGIIVPGHA